MLIVASQDCFEDVLAALPESHHGQVIPMVPSMVAKRLAAEATVVIVAKVDETKDIDLLVRVLAALVHPTEKGVGRVQAYYFTGALAERVVAATNLAHELPRDVAVFRRQLEDDRRSGHAPSATSAPRRTDTRPVGIAPPPPPFSPQTVPGMGAVRPRARS